MLRARFPLAVAALAATIALVPATSASAADAPSLPGLPSQVQDALDQLGGAGGSGTPDLGGAVTELTDCLAATPEATEDEGQQTPGDTATTESAAPESNASPGTSSRQSTAGTEGQAADGSADAPAPGGSNPVEGALTGQSASSVTVLAADLDPIGDPLDAGQECIEDFLAGLGAAQAKCFSDNNFTAGYLLEKLEEGLGGTPPGADDIAEFQQNLTGLLACLQGGTPSETPSSAPPVSSGGGAEAPVSEEAPAAVAVTGTPNFTG